MDRSNEIEKGLVAELKKKYENKPAAPVQAANNNSVAALRVQFEQQTTNNPAKKRATTTNSNAPTNFKSSTLTTTTNVAATPVVVEEVLEPTELLSTVNTTPPVLPGNKPKSILFSDLLHQAQNLHSSSLAVTQPAPVIVERVADVQMIDLEEQQRIQQQRQQQRPQTTTLAVTPVNSTNNSRNTAARRKSRSTCSAGNGCCLACCCALLAFGVLLLIKNEFPSVQLPDWLSWVPNIKNGFGVGSGDHYKVSNSTVLTLEASVNDPTGFKIRFAYPGDFPADVKPYLNQARDRWQKVITGALPGTVHLADNFRCNNMTLSTNGTEFNDLLLMVHIGEIDGSSNIAAYASGCAIAKRGNGTFPSVAEVKIDVQDLRNSIKDGTILDILTHEFGHALGMGPGTPIYDASLKTVNGGQMRMQNDVVRTGSAAVGRNEYPLMENIAHWSAANYPNELMNPFESGGHLYLSRLTASLMKALGYEVNLDATEQYNAIRNGRRLRSESAQVSCGGGVNGAVQDITDSVVYDGDINRKTVTL